MALALYRKYRPATFAEVVGQEHVTDPLRTALAAGRINHAYLFSGPRGCGKTSSARIMARSLNCVKGPTPDPCGECNSCKALAPEGSGSVDVTELDAASHGGVDDARELRDRAFYAPAESRYRVFIIDEAHMVTTQGFNALLKIVEEPPEHLIFIFATTEPEKVLPTIRSRTHHYPFRLIPPSSMRALLERNVAAEGVEVDPAVYPLVIRAGGGSARDTQSVLDQLLAGAGPNGVDYGRAVALLGVTDVALIDDMVDGLAADDPTAVFGTVERLTEAGHDPRRFATDLLDRLRDLILLRAVPDAAAKGLISAPGDELDRMQSQAEKIGSATLSRYAEIVHNGLLEMRGATAPRLLLELLCARMLLPSASEGEAAVLQRLERMERRVAAGTVSPMASSPTASSMEEPQRQQSRSEVVPSQSERSFQRPSSPRSEPAVTPVPPSPAIPTPANSGPVKPAAVKPEAPSVPSSMPAQSLSAKTAEEPAVEKSAADGRVTDEPIADGKSAESAETASLDAVADMPADPPSLGVIDATAVRRAWPQLLDSLRQTPGNRSTGAMLAQASVQSVEGTVVVLAHPAAPLAKRLAEAHNAEKIAAAFREVLGGEWQVKCVHAATAVAASTSVEPQEAPQRSFQRSSRETGTGPENSPENGSQNGAAATSSIEVTPPAASTAAALSTTSLSTAGLSTTGETSPSAEVDSAEAVQPDAKPAVEGVGKTPENVNPPTNSAEIYPQDEDEPYPPEEEDFETPERPDAGEDPTAIAHKLLEEHLGARLLD